MRALLKQLCYISKHDVCACVCVCACMCVCVRARVCAFACASKAMPAAGLISVVVCTNGN